MALYKCSL